MAVCCHPGWVGPLKFWCCGWLCTTQGKGQGRWPWPGNPWLQAVGLNTWSLLHHGALKIGVWFQEEVAGEDSRLSCGCNAKGILVASFTRTGPAAEASSDQP